MKLTSLIMGLSSIGFILIGIFVMKSKSIANSVGAKEEKDNANEFVRKNANLNITVGILGVIIAIVDLLTSSMSKILIIIFVLMISLSSLIQYSLSKKFRG